MNKFRKHATTPCSVVLFRPLCGLENNILITLVAAYSNGYVSSDDEDDSDDSEEDDYMHYLPHKNKPVAFKSRTQTNGGRMHLSPEV